MAIPLAGSLDYFGDVASGTFGLFAALDPNRSVDAVNPHLVAKPVLLDRRVEIAFFQAKSSATRVFPHLAIIENEIHIPVITRLARRNDRAVSNIP